MKTETKTTEFSIDELIDKNLIIPRDKIITGNIYQIERSNSFYIAILDNKEIIHAYINCENPEYSYLNALDNKDLNNDLKKFKLDPDDIIYELSPHSLMYASALFQGLNIFWNSDLGIVEKVFFVQDLKVLPLDKFLGVHLERLYNNQAIGTINFDILHDYEAKSVGNYHGLSGKSYKIALPYSDDTILLWQKYKKTCLKSAIESNFPALKDYIIKDSLI